jgi:hypothetical protein
LGNADPVHRLAAKGALGQGNIQQNDIHLVPLGQLQNLLHILAVKDLKTSPPSQHLLKNTGVDRIIFHQQHCCHR